MADGFDPPQHFVRAAETINSTHERSGIRRNVATSPDYSSGVAGGLGVDFGPRHIEHHGSTVEWHDAVCAVLNTIRSSSRGRYRIICPSLKGVGAALPATAYAV